MGQPRWPRFLWMLWMGKRVTASISFDPRDAWIGVYWKEPYWEAWTKEWECYICIIPCFPINVVLTVRNVIDEAKDTTTDGLGLDLLP